MWSIVGLKGVRGNLVTSCSSHVETLSHSLGVTPSRSSTSSFYQLIPPWWFVLTGEITHTRWMWFKDGGRGGYTGFVSCPHMIQWFIGVRWSQRAHEGTFLLFVSWEMGRITGKWHCFRVGTRKKCTDVLFMFLCKEMWSNMLSQLFCMIFHFSKVDKKHFWTCLWKLCRSFIPVFCGSVWFYLIW